MKIIIIVFVLIFINNVNCLNRKSIFPKYKPNEKYCIKYALNKSNINNYAIFNKCLDTNNKEICDNITNYDLYIHYKKKCIRNDEDIYGMSCLFVLLAFILIPCIIDK